MPDRDTYELAIAHLFREKWRTEGWDMVDMRELLQLAKDHGISERLAVRIVDQLESNGEISRDGRHFRGGANLVLRLEQEVDRSLFYESNVARRELLEAAADALDADTDVSYYKDGRQSSYTDRPWNEVRWAAKFVEMLGWGEMRETLGGHFDFEISADGYDLARDGETLTATLPISIEEDEAASDTAPALEESVTHESPIERRQGEPGVFISYSHRDEGFVVALVEGLRQLNLRVWIDRVELAIGDSLVSAISEAILAQDFVVAIVSEHSVSSGWCQKELSLAMNRGINDRQVVVLPVRLGDVDMPASLTDVLHIPAKETTSPIDVARELARSIEKHLARRSRG